MKISLKEIKGIVLCLKEISLERHKHLHAPCDFISHFCSILLVFSPEIYVAPLAQLIRLAATSVVWVGDFLRGGGILFVFGGWGGSFGGFFILFGVCFGRVCVCSVFL